MRLMGVKILKDSLSYWTENRAFKAGMGLAQGASFLWICVADTSYIIGEETRETNQIKVRGREEMSAAESEPGKKCGSNRKVPKGKWKPL